jgi:hypothetical protein
MSGGPGDASRPAPPPNPPQPGGDAPRPAAAPDPAPAANGEEYRCDLCGAPMKEWHCRIICTFCGYQRDCSDP